MNWLLTLIISVCVVQMGFADEIDDKLRALLKAEKITPSQFTPNFKAPMFKLGGRLFREKLLSGNKNISCMTCHHPAFGTGDGLPLGIGEGGVGMGNGRRMGEGRIIARHSPHVQYFGDNMPSSMFWDGRVAYNKVDGTFSTPEPGLNGKNPQHPEYTSVLDSSLAAQALFPPLSFDEMRGRPGTNNMADFKDNFKVWEEIMARLVGRDNGRLGGVESYKKLFKEAFPAVESLDELNFAHAAVAIAHFQKQLFSQHNSPFDAYVAGDNSAMSEKEKRGAVVFYGTGRCFQCHSGLYQTDNDFHNVAFPQIGPGKETSRDDKGRYYITKKDEDLYKFKTPSLRNVSLTAPYGHSGSLRTLELVVSHYVRPMRSNHHYEIPRSGLPYKLEPEFESMNKRLRLIDPKIERMGIPMNPQDRDDLVSFLRDGLTDK